MCEAFGCSKFDERSAVFHAALGFMKGSQLKNHSRQNEENKGEQDDDPTGPEKRCHKKGRKIFLAEMVAQMYEGKLRGT